MHQPPRTAALPSRRRWARTGASLALVALLTCSAGGCTAAPGDGGSASSRTAAPSTSSDSNAGPSVPAATLATTTEEVEIIPDGTPGEVSLALSRALFATTPVVVVAPSDDEAGLRDGSAAATRLGVPLLLVDDHDPTGSGAAPSTRATPSTPASPSTPATPTVGATSATPLSTSSTLEPALSAEVARLGARSVLATSPSLARRLGRVPNVRIVTEPGALPPVSRGPANSTLTVLVRKGDDGSVSAAVTASAAAAGAAVLPVTGNDPRADPTAIAALAQSPPKHVLAVGDAFGPADRLSARLRVAETGIQLPGGGQTVFPGRRLVALYGHPGTASLGVLGEQGLSASISRAKKLAAQYDPLSTEPVVPAFEIIATTAQREPGPDGDYSGESSVSSLRPWVEAARKAGVYVVLDLQPGRADFLDQAKRYRDLLLLPNVGLALDPEWKLAPGQRPLGQIGGVDADEVNSVVTWLADLTAKEALPQKLLVLHQFRLSMLRDEKRIDTGRDEVQVLVHMDGQGTPVLKDGTWRAVTGAAPKGVPFGWKNFYDEDHPMLTPAQTMAKRPKPFMVSYQ